MQLDIDSVLEIVTRSLPKAGVPVVMIGGHAVNVYGVLRATQDIDFMIATEHEDTVREIMRDAGFTNISTHENVIFYTRADSPLRVDFLKVDPETMGKLLANAVEVDYFDGHKVRVPQLRDLLAMKLFALSSGGAKREEKDFQDVVKLIIENDLQLNEDFSSLCRDFASEEISLRVFDRIKELRHA